MLYHWYELSHAAVKPARAAVDTYCFVLDHPFNPWSYTTAGRNVSAACKVFERTTRRYPKPEFGITTTSIDGQNIAVSENVVWQTPFCRLLHFARDIPSERAQQDPPIVIVAPMSGHFATLLRGTVKTLLPNHEIYITDWVDARQMPVEHGTFDLDTYIDHIIDIMAFLKGDAHIFAVCQPCVPVLAATARMEAEQSQYIPQSIILAGGPVDTRVNPTAVNGVAISRGTRWFEDNVLATVPWPHKGFGRKVYPGFMQLTGFMAMNLDRHLNAHQDLFVNLIRGDGDSARKHQSFYDEYLAVMDLTAEYYLQTIESVFIRHELARGEMKHRTQPIDLTDITRVPLMTIEGEKDDITGLGQCRQALEMTKNLNSEMKVHYEASGVGHYGVFNGSRFHDDIAPRISQFTMTHDRRSSQIATTPAMTIETKRGGAAA
ncbi:MAG: polyhydroxyalkanoate depolymerase [Hyphomicrobiaceae bacterium]